MVKILLVHFTNQNSNNFSLLSKKLPEREIVSGYAEILKYSLIKDKRFFSWLENNSKKILKLNSKACAEAIRESCRIKS